MNCFKFSGLTGLLVVLGWFTAFAGEAREIEVHGHRGARASYPENSLSAFAFALEIGADDLEMDLRLSRDGQVVISHDASINTDHCLEANGQRVTGDIPISSLTLAELKSYDCGSLPNAEFPLQHRVPGSRIATLAEVFALVRSSPSAFAATVNFNIEFKANPLSQAPSPEKFAETVLPLIRDAGMLERMTIQSFHPSYAHAANSLARKLGRVSDPRVIMPPFSVLRGFPGRWLVRYFHGRGVRVIPWTANTPEEWQALIDLGVDGIITDDPAGLLAYLRARGLHS